MPTSFVGLLIFIAFLAPGFLHAQQRKVLVPQGELSPLFEAASVVSVSLASNGIVALLFGVIRALDAKHTPAVQRLLEPRSAYFREHLSYVLGWSSGLLLLSCAIAIGCARNAAIRKVLSAGFSPVISELSVWCQAFNAADEDEFPFAGLVLQDGSYVQGRVVYFSTDVEETGDRDLLLGPPLTVVDPTNASFDLGQRQVVVSARDIRRIDVAYVRDPAR
jgi:hypothetical protein